MRGMLGDYLRAVQLKQQHEQFQQQHDLAQKQLEELSKYHQTELDRMQNEFNLRKTEAAQTLKQHLIDQIASGVQQPPENAQPTGVNVQYGTDQNSNLPSALNSVLPQAQGVSSTGSQFQLSPEDLGGLASGLSPAERTINVTSPEQIARQQASAAGQKKAAEVTAEAPTRESAQQIAQTRANATEQAATTRAESAKNIAENKNATLLHKMDIIDATQKYKTDHNLNNVNTDELSGQADDASLGVGDLPKGSNGIHTESIIRGTGRVPFQSAQGKQIDALNDMDGLVQDMQTAANRLPDTTQGLQQAEQFGNKLISKLPWQTDLKNDMASIKAKAPGIVRAVGGVGSGRVTNTEIGAQMDNLINAGMSKQQALGKIAQFQRDMYTKTYSDLLGSVPTKQKVAILSKHGGIDKWRGVNVLQKDGTVGPVIKKMPNGHEAMYNPNKDNYEDIEDYK